MKKILFALLAFPCLAQAGTITTAFSPIGQIVISSGTPIATGILFDSFTQSGAASGAGPLTFNLTIGSGANRLLAVLCGVGNGNRVTGITVGGNAMTYSTSNVAGINFTAIYTYIAPASGSQAIAVTTSDGDMDHALCWAESLSGVAQTSPVDAANGVINSPGGGTTTVPLTTSVSNDLLLDVFFDDNNDTPSPGSGQTQRGVQQHNSNGTSAGSTKMATTPGSYNMTWTAIETNTLQTAIAIKPAP